ncbi:hypothetical protein V6N11_069418 [Hibiscus sabdariffa]|uniref:Uncharacterized protein n=2 Tax=Hibiscus sabdariffa TaxID=183260 RepID=A0ABR1ZKS8_9ROSI
MLSIFSLGFSLEIPSCRYRLALLVESLLVIGGTCDCRPTNHYLSGYCGVFLLVAHLSDQLLWSPILDGSWLCSIWFFGCLAIPGCLQPLVLPSALSLQVQR